MLKPEHQFLLPQLTALNSRMVAGFSKAVGLHVSRFRVLFLLHVLGQSTPGALLRQTVMDAAALTRVLNDFERLGLVSRRADPSDARQRLIDLTDKGRDLIGDKLDLRDAFIGEALAGLDADELAAFSRLLGRVEANVSRAAELPAVGDSLNIDPRRNQD